MGALRDVGVMLRGTISKGFATTRLTDVDEVDSASTRSPNLAVQELGGLARLSKR